MRAQPIIVWFRLDLRVADNPALIAAVNNGAPVIPVFIWSPREEGLWAPGGASRWWLHQSLYALMERFEQMRSRLVLRCGGSEQELMCLIEETGAEAVYWNRRYEPAVRERDTKIKETLRARKIAVESFHASLLHEPWTIKNRSGKPFQMFTPFWRHCLSLSEPAAPARIPAKIPAPTKWPESLPLDSLELKPKPDWAGGLRATWCPGEEGANKALKKFVKATFDQYGETRNTPAIPGTSRLSPHLHFGEMSPQQIWHAIRAIKASAESTSRWRSSQYVTELGWREFSHHLLYHFPRTDQKPLRDAFENFRWERNPEWLGAWQKGRTGYPIVDAGMRELWRTGWMHNRVRMIVASFLVKDLRISWLEGAKWFWDTLVDADLAQNTLGWQWTAGCGADAAPYFRIFNPVLQGEKFDRDGEYVRKWVPEIAGLDDRWIHKPHEAPAEALALAGITLGKTYPAPIVSHTIAREVALEEYNRIKG